MTDEEQLRLECVRLGGGQVDFAQRIYEFVIQKRPMTFPLTGSGSSTTTPPTVLPSVARGIV